MLILLMAISSYSISDYCWLLVAILLMVICGYYISGYSINSYSWVFY
jgi:hypothetical protein